MGFPGCKVIRHRGYFFMWDDKTDGGPEHLGAQMFAMIPKDPQTRESWAQNLRDEMEGILAAYIKEFGKVTNRYIVKISDNLGVCVSDWYRTYDWYGYTYEINLDQMLFHVQLHPVFRLDNMPPVDVFVKAHNAATKYFRNSPDYRSNMFTAHHGVFLRLIPKEYHLDIFGLGAPTIKDERLETYDRYLANTVTEPEDVLSLDKSLTRAEAVSLRVLGTYVNLYATHRRDVILEELGLAADREQIGCNGRDIACALAAVALLPFHTLELESSRFEEAQYKFLFLRKHICFSLATHLHDERNVRFHISRVVEHIMSSPTVPSVVFGVVFSLFHCVVFRVDKAAGGKFTRTEVLDFLTPPHNPTVEGPPDKWLTAGIKVLVRLGHCEAADDIEFFHHNLSSKWWVTPHTYDSDTTEESSQSSPDSSDGDISLILRPQPVRPLPFELLSMIVNEIEQGDTLYSFALASKVFMAAALPRLRLPQIRGETFRAPNLWLYEGYPITWGHGHILESFNDKIFPFVFDITVDDYPALLAIATKEAAPHIFKTETASMMPQDTIEWSDTWGRSYGAYPRFRPIVYESLLADATALDRRLRKPHVSLGYATDFSADMVRRFREGAAEEIRKEAEAEAKRLLAEQGKRRRGKKRKSRTQTQGGAEEEEGTKKRKAKERDTNKKETEKKGTKHKETTKRERKAVPSSTRILRSNAKVTQGI